jgi:NADH:ubiquinone oxidoreductase subunit H
MDINLVSITINIIFVFITYSLITAFYIYYNRKSAAEINKKLAEGRKARNGENN